MNRQFKKKFLLLVEGDTEKNYFSEFKKNNPNNFIDIQPVNVKGGGYSTFLNRIYREPGTGYLGIGIVLDLDRANSASQELICLNKLVKECNRRNKCKTAILLFGSYEKFEYFLACHFDKFNPSCDAVDFLKSKCGYRDSSDIKNDCNIYHKCNSQELSMQIFDVLNKRGKYFNNDFSLKLLKGEVRNKIIVNNNFLSVRHSNVHEIFKLLAIKE